MLVFVALVSTFTYVCGRGSFAGSRPIDSSNLQNRFLGDDTVVERTTRVYPSGGLSDHIGFGDQGVVEGMENLNQFNGYSSGNQNQNQNQFTSNSLGNLNQFTSQTTQRPFTTLRPQFIRPPAPSTYQKTNQNYNGFNSGYNKGGYNKQWSNGPQFQGQQPQPISWLPGYQQNGQTFAGGPANVNSYSKPNFNAHGYQNKYIHNHHVPANQYQKNYFNKKQFSQNNQPYFNVLRYDDDVEDDFENEDEKIVFKEE